MLPKPGTRDLHRVTVTVSAGGEGVAVGLATATDRDHEHIDAYTEETSKRGESTQCAADPTTARSRSPQWERWV